MTRKHVGAALCAAALVLCSCAGVQDAAVTGGTVSVSVSVHTEDVPHTAGMPDGAYRLHTEIPSFPEYEELSAAIARTAERWRASFVAAAESTAASGSAAECVFMLSWRPVQISSRYISVLLEGYQYSGGANGMPLLASFTWDSTETRLTTLEDLFSEQADAYEYVSAYAREELTGRLCTPESDPDGTVRRMIEAGTAPLHENFGVFTVSPDAVTIYFNKYQAAPGSAGVQTVQIPYRG